MCTIPTTHQHTCSKDIFQKHDEKTASEHLDEEQQSIDWRKFYSLLYHEILPVSPAHAPRLNDAHFSERADINNWDFRGDVY